MNEYDKAEQEGRTYFHELFPNYTKDYSQEKYSWWDVSGYTQSPNSIDKPYVAEIKKRVCKHDDYPSVMFESSKYESLNSYSLQSGIPTFYVCIYSDKTLLYNVAKIESDKLVREMKWLPATSAEDNGYKLKEVMYLPLADATKLSRGYKKLKQN